MERRGRRPQQRGRHMFIWRRVPHSAPFYFCFRSVPQSPQQLPAQSCVEIVGIAAGALVGLTGRSYTVGGASATSAVVAAAVFI